MGFRLKIFLMLAVVFVLMLIQIIVTMSLTNSMNASIQTESEHLLSDLTGIINGTVATGSAEALKAGANDLSTNIAAAKAILQTAKLFYIAEMHFSASSEDATKLAIKESENFCMSVLSDAPPSIHGLGATFEVNAFSEFIRYFVPYGYKEDGALKYSARLDVDDANSNPPPTEEQRMENFNEEISREYYTLSIPKDHNPKTPAPEEVHFTEPYFDWTTGVSIISLTTPINDGSKAVGVVFTDLSLENLAGLLSKFAARTKNTQGFSFSWRTGNILGAVEMPEYLPREVPDPEHPGETKYITSKFSDIPVVGEKVREVTSQMKHNDVKIDVLELNNVHYNIVVYNESDLFGIVLLIPNRELFADTIKSQDLMTNLYMSQEKELRKVQITTVGS
ncbi:MAG: cache domain-containing protein, partial [Deltaproteobacteria bacterium]|nr:cache domain-containing protein [Deltaproteobacteria bacterium]